MPRNILNIEEFNKIPDGEYFAHGVTLNSPSGVFMTSSPKYHDRILLWVAVKGYGNDWKIYTHWKFDEFSGEERSIDWVAKYGDKITSKDNIRFLMPCTDEVFALYRY